MADHKSIPFDESVGSVLYTRDTFVSAKLNSYVEPPAENPDDFNVFQNLLPVSRGVLERRWGYQFVADPANLNSISRLYDYESDSTGNRRLVACGLDGSGNPTIQIIQEDGTNLVRMVQIPLATTTNIPRAVISRDYIYATAGVAGTQYKWTDTVGEDAATIWGLEAPGNSQTTATIAGTGASVTT